MKNKTLFAALLMLALAGCQLVSPPADFPVAGPSADSVFNPEKVDFENAYNLILKPQCLRCHSVNAEIKGDVTLDTHDDVVFYLQDLLKVVEKNSMPPKRGLPERQRNYLLQWLQDGAPVQEKPEP